MDRNTALQYRQRWQAVAESERLEQQQATVAQRWNQFHAIMQFSRFAKRPSEDEAAQIVASRWQKSRQYYDERHQQS